LTIVEALLKLGAVWTQLGNSMIFNEASWRIAIRGKTRSEGSITYVALIKSLHFWEAPVFGGIVYSPIFFTICSPIWRRVSGRSGAILVVIIIDEWKVECFESGERCARIIEVMFAIKEETFFARLHAPGFLHLIFGIRCQAWSGPTDDFLGVISKDLACEPMSDIPGKTDHSSTNEGRFLAPNLSMVVLVIHTRHAHNVPEEEEKKHANVNSMTFEDLERRSVT